MTSSTLNSEPASPPWGRVWVLTGMVVLLVAGSWELIVRAADLGPEYADNRSLWAHARHALNREDESAIALLGASRIQRGIDVDTLSNAFGRPVVQLAVEGTSALATLENLAFDPRFRGTVIYSVAPPFTFNRFQPRGERGKQRQWLDHYAGQQLSHRIEQSLRVWFQGRVAFRSADARPARIVPQLISTGDLPGRDQKTTFANRVVHMDYDKMPVAANEVGIMQLILENAAPYKADEWSLALNYMSALVETLRARGCDVIFVQLPTGQQVGALETVFFPRGRFWADMEQNLDAQFIHTADYPQLDGFVSVDGSHIQSPRIVEFTRRLADVLRANGLESRQPES